MGGIIFYINERVMMTSIIIEFFKVIKRCIFIEKQKKLNSSAIMIPDLTNTHFNRNEKDSLISRVIKYYEDKLSVIIFYLGNNSCNEDKIINLKEPYNVELRGNRRINTLRITLRFAVRYIKCMLIGNTVEVALLKDLYKYELCKVSPLNIEKIVFTQSSKWSHELWPIAYNKKRVLIAYGGSFWGFKTKQHGYIDEYCYYHYQKWDEILHWNKILGKFERCSIKKKPIICHIEPITPQGRVSSKYEKISIQRDKYILVFDSLPYTEFGKICSSLGERYRTIDMCTRFIVDIIEEANQSGIDVVIKPKRDIDIPAPYYSCESYFQRLKQYEIEKKAVIANKNVQISGLIEKSLMVISAPFTSTSLYSYLAYNKPSYFYDPSGKLFADDRAAMKLHLIKGRNELKALITNYSMKKHL